MTLAPHLLPLVREKIARYGKTATLEQGSGTYNPDTGAVTNSVTSTSIKVILAGSSRATAVVDALAYATLYVAADVTPKAGDVVILDGQRLKVAGAEPTYAEDTVVLWKLTCEK